VCEINDTLHFGLVGVQIVTVLLVMFSVSVCGNDITVNIWLVGV
jgi:hypothetical protein